MAFILIIYKRKVRQTLRNMGQILVSLVTFKLPSHRVSLDHPGSLKVPFGVAVAISALLYAAVQWPPLALLIGTLGGILLIGLFEFSQPPTDNHDFWSGFPWTRQGISLLLGEQAMSKLVLFLSGMLLGSFLTGFIMLHERDRRIELGPQPADCGDAMSKVESGSH